MPVALYLAYVGLFLLLVSLQVRVRRNSQMKSLVGGSFSGAKNPPEALHYMTNQLSFKLTVEFFVDTNMQSDNNT